MFEFYQTFQVMVGLSTYQRFRVFNQLKQFKFLIILLLNHEDDLFEFACPFSLG